MGEKIGLDFDKFGGETKGKWLQSVDKDIYSRKNNDKKKGQTDQTETLNGSRYSSG
ncbi:MAG: hypothetical protein CM15mP111_4480 [Hyphomicrobiales bacterium]|nr:MAG: hypothetical protein CM15mP111_4480 [Hyphomicrobiales bacterium]